LDPTGNFAYDGVQELSFDGVQDAGPDGHDDQDIWNHEIHWMRRKVSAEALRLLRRHDAECAAGRKEPE
jgi:hypothetical protein